MNHVGRSIGEPVAIRYAFLSAKLAGLLAKEDIVTEDAEVKSLLDQGLRFVDDLINARNFYAHTSSAAPRGDALEAYSCALSIVISHRETFGVKDPDDLVRLVLDIKKCLEGLRSGVSCDSERAELFFSQFGELMLSNLNVQHQPMLRPV